jgi:Tol biopolymer transport system component
MSENSSAHGRLDSWKEIADYLKRDIRTAIRWGKNKGMPVHRVPGGKRQAVFAFKEEIDTWLVSQEHENTALGSFNGEAGHAADLLRTPNGSREDAIPRPVGDSASRTSQQPWTVRAVRANLRSAAIIGAGLVGVVGIISVLMARSHTPSVVRPFSLQKLTNDGRSKAQIRTDGRTLYFNLAEGRRSILASAPMSGSPIRLIDTPFSNVMLQDLSNGGQNLLFTSYEGISPGGPLWTIPVQGGTPRPVGNTVCTWARWSPDNRRIACAHRTTITVMDTDGSNPHAVAAFTWPVDGVVWTPDGARLRFVVQDNTAHICSQWEVGVSQSGTAGHPQRLSGTGCGWDWTWTQDGKVSWYVERDLAGKTHLMMAVGSAPATELPISIGTMFNITANTTNNDLYLLITGAYTNELLQYDAKQRVLHSFLSGISGEYVAYSPDRHWITYADLQDGALWRSRADGSQALQLTKPPMEVEVSAWSPDGRRIAFMGRRPGKPWRIYLIGRDGGPFEEASEGLDNQGGPSWSPDGTMLAYANASCESTQDCWVWRLDPRTRKAEIIPGSNGFRTARWSPDGKYIAALQFEKHKLMLLDVAHQRWRVLADSATGDNVNWSSDSRDIYVDGPNDKNPVVERVRVRDGKRVAVAHLATYQNAPGMFSNWFGLTPDNSPLLSRVFNTTDIYKLEWTDH